MCSLQLSGNLLCTCFVTCSYRLSYSPTGDCPFFLIFFHLIKISQPRLQGRHQFLNFEKSVFTQFSQNFTKSEKKLEKKIIFLNKFFSHKKRCAIEMRVVSSKSGENTE